MVENMGYEQEKLKDIVEKEAEGEQQQEKEDINLKPHERTLKGAYRSFVMPGLPKTDIYLKQILLIVILIKPNHISRRSLKIS